MKKLTVSIILSIIALTAFAQKETVEIDTAVMMKNLRIDTTKFYHPHELALHITPAYSALLYKGNAAKSHGGFNVGIGLDYTYWFHRNVGVSIGAQWMRYTGVYDFNGYTEVSNHIDHSDPIFEPDGDPYTLTGIYNMKEKQYAHYIETPIKLTFAAPMTEKSDFRAAIGFNPGFRVADRQTTKGPYMRRVDYTEGHYTIDEVESLRLGTFSGFSEPTSKPLFSYSLGIIADIGWAIKLTPQWKLHAGLSGGYGFNDVRTKAIRENPKVFQQLEGGYSGVVTTDHIGAVHTFFAGIKIGVSYAFGTCCAEKKYRKAQADFELYMRDSDGDGVPDRIDECPDTPQGVVVDSVGCPVDSDGDGVPDYIDECPDTPKGVVVDSVGCPIDDDGDGVPNYIDECPDTPQGVVVDSVGCPVDTDGDGIPDYLDKCPNVPGPESNYGCPELKKEVRSLFKKAMQGIQFETDKDVIKKSSYPTLDKIVEVMKTNPTYMLSIGGHTDDVGSEEYNQVLSEKRAGSVRRYLIEHGVEESRIASKGYGKTMPIADNTTVEGRALNRRVEFEVIFEKVTFEKIINPELKNILKPAQK
ncbi:MAG: OmpA family protein [Paludibacteraceae bacterium]|jgi:outer membrane protein OmpA-like peptidoglycan-associated protein|nr:OmpA family protein [Paludibacteraceae bacterium]MBP9039847.1 OmpA family protein [Paludibacteraceae bacterium]HHT61463.1 OmpA family protein [Bacteroidales bacterium]